MILTANTVSATSTFKSRKNAADGGQSISIPASTAGVFEDTSGSDSITAGDTFNYEIVTGSGTGSLTLQLTHTMLQSESVGVAVQGKNNFGTLNPSITRFLTLEGSATPVSTETYTQFLSRIGFLRTSLFVYVSVNSLTGSSTVRTRKNTADGNLAVSIAGGTTGAFEDYYTGSGHFDSVADSDLVNEQIVTGSGGSITIVMVAVSTAQLLALSITDSGAGADAATLEMSTTVLDIAASLDIVALSAAFTVADAASGFDVWTTGVGIAVSDVAVGVDIISEIGVEVADFVLAAEFAWRLKGYAIVDDFVLPHVLKLAVHDEAEIRAKLRPDILPLVKMVGKRGRVAEIEGWTREQSDIDALTAFLEGGKHVLILPTGDSFNVLIVNCNVSRHVDLFERRPYHLILMESR